MYCILSEPATAVVADTPAGDPLTEAHISKIAVNKIKYGCTPFVTTMITSDSLQVARTRKRRFTDIFCSVSALLPCSVDSD